MVHSGTGSINPSCVYSLILVGRFTPADFAFKRGGTGEDGDQISEKAICVNMLREIVSLAKMNIGEQIETLQLRKQ